LEKKLFAIPDPDPKEFKKKYPKDSLKAQQELNEAIKKVEERRKAIYVESGGVAGVKGEVDAKVAKAEGSIEATTGNRIDFQSLMNRKGGAGKKNVGSDSILAGMTRNVLGEGRGAQKHVGRSVHSLTVAGSVSASVGVASIGGGASLAMKWANDGVSKTRTGKESKTTAESITMQLTGELGISFSQAVGLDGVMGDLLDHLQEKLEEYISGTCKKAATEAEQKDGEGDKNAEKALNEMVALEKVALGYEDLKKQLTDQIVSAIGGSTSSEEKYSLSLSFDAVSKDVAIELKKVSKKGLDLPKSVSMSLEQSSRLFKLKYSGGKWTKG
jgi:hypothetical protein